MLRGRGRGNRKSTSTKVPIKGLFSDGIWKCNCDPRLPAQHFPVKNGGKNHGRWFYTCQLPQHKRCDFFLWDDEAKGREAAAVLNNSRTEPSIEPITPRKLSNATGLATPQSGAERARVRFDNAEARASNFPKEATTRNVPSVPPSKNNSQIQATATTAATTSDDEFYDWPASDEEELGRAADQVSTLNSFNIQQENAAPHPLPETPHKAQKRDTFATPSSHKRRFDEVSIGARDGDQAPEVVTTAAELHAYPTPSSMHRPGRPQDEDVFTTPSTTLKPSARLSDFTAETPTPTRFKEMPSMPSFMGARSSTSDSSTLSPSLTTEILSALTAHSVTLPAPATESITSICDKYTMQMRGITRGRDVSRETVKAKEGVIVNLTSEIEMLKSERETNRHVIRTLKGDMVSRGSSRSRGRGRQ